MATSRRSRRHRRVREAPAPRYAAKPKKKELTGVLLDSDVIIEILRGRRKIVEAATALEGSGIPTYCSPISWAEIYAGLRPGEETLTEAFFRARGEVVLDAVAGRQAGAYLARHARTHGLEVADALVAAAAATSGLHLWTLNRRHYPMRDLEFYEP
jgi:predicted nucleic acid-binding protein